MFELYLSTDDGGEDVAVSDVTSIAMASDGEAPTEEEEEDRIRLGFQQKHG